MIETWILRIGLALTVSFIVSDYYEVRRKSSHQFKLNELLSEPKAAANQLEIDSTKFTNYTVSWSVNPRPRFVTAYHPGLGRSSYQRCDLFTE